MTNNVLTKNDEVIDAHTDQIRGEKAHLSVADALGRLSDQQEKRFVTLFEHGSLQIEMYAPRGIDLQKPHTRDEIYVVAAGRGTFFNGVTRRDFGPGDLIFAPAGSDHRFESFSDDLAVWVMFYGLEGGESQEPEDVSHTA